MSRSLSLWLGMTDIGFLVYWLAAGLSALSLVDLPGEWMYANYDRADVIAWNWSFFPLDLAFSYFGLRAVAAARRGKPWRESALVSLTLTMAAGGMAVGYWTLLCEFDPMWFGANALLVLWPLFYMRELMTGQQPAA